MPRISKGREGFVSGRIFFFFTFLFLLSACGHEALPAETGETKGVRKPAAEEEKRSLFAPPRNPLFLREETKNLLPARNSSPAPPREITPPSLRLDSSILILVLVGMVLLFWGALWLIKRWVPGGRQLFASPAIEVLGRTHLDPQRYLALIRVGRRLLVVGVSPDEMHPLSEIIEAEEVSDLLATAKPKTETGRSLFQRLFQRQVELATVQAERGRLERVVTEFESSLGDLRRQIRSLREAEG